MTNERFKQLFETNRVDLINLCYLYYLEEAKGQKCNRETFDDLFHMFIMTRGGVGSIINYLKQKHQL